MEEILEEKFQIGGEQLDALEKDEKWYALVKKKFDDDDITVDGLICLFYKYNCFQSKTGIFLKAKKSEWKNIFLACGTLANFNKATYSHATYFGGKLRKPRNYERLSKRDVETFEGESFEEVLKKVKSYLVACLL